MSTRVSPTERIRAEIDELFASDRELGDGSKSTVSRVCEAIKVEFETSQRRDLSGLEIDYLFADGSHFKYHRRRGPPAHRALRPALREGVPRGRQVPAHRCRVPHHVPAVSQGALAQDPPLQLHRAHLWRIDSVLLWSRPAGSPGRATSSSMAAFSSFIPASAPRWHTNHTADGHRCLARHCRCA